MTTKSSRTAQTIGPGAPRVPTPRERRAYAAQKRNHQFFLDHKWELFDRFPNHSLLIYDDQIVEAFADPLDCIDRRDALDSEQRATVWIGRPHRAGHWSL